MLLLLNASPYWPFAVLLLAIIAVVVMITVLRLHAFVALMLSAIFVGLISAELPEVAGQSALVRAIELPMVEFGVLAGKIAWVIALAAIIGTAMMESGAADKIVNALVGSLGEKRAPVALLASGLVLSIPVFFDTVFFLLIPLARSLGLKTGKNYMLYVMAMAGGAAISHTLIPPTPGPLIMAETMNIDLGVVIMAGLMASILPAIAALMTAKRINLRMPIPVRPLGEEHDENVSNVEQLPGLFVSVLPILIPVGLISLVSILGVGEGDVPPVIDFLGNKNLAMFLGTALAIWLWAKQRGLNMLQIGKYTEESLQIAGVIILITSAGGAFGAMIKHSGIGDAIELATQNFEISYILLAWVIAAVMKIAQGSSTVAMITAASIVSAILETGGEPSYPPILILLAIGFGSAFITWMNDSGFWVVAKMSGFTERETLKSWTVVLGVIGVVGLIQLLVLSWIL